MAPGLTVTSAIAISVDTVNVLESTIFTLPPVRFVAGMVEDEKLKAFGT
jgi:hypothetical protein